ncbi:Pycsar system effector family protein [Sphingopyxis sp. PET50]|uniref:Pycsar system effector family protein n=1 Tax=Sphingopyxis sp. PET50 TaxID=2976533 RepID=UPI0021AE3BCB|nr:Pycsar system effector family protein [Sphingopyxis sp. PET50]
MVQETKGEEKPATSFPVNAAHLVRTTQQLTMQLSQMADQKASILMGATFVVFTLAVGQARSGGGALAMPLTILATFSFLSALLAVSAVLPRVGKGPPVDYRDGKDHSNILFFGRFAQMSEDEFIAAIKERMRTEEDMYEAMLRDTYQNGIVLARRKYRYLAYAYRLFVVGLSLTFAAFAVEMVMLWSR